MSKTNKIEVEKKYLLLNSSKLIEECKKDGFKLVGKKNIETDIYFTDSKLDFIKNRVCLRIRKTSKLCEITYKGPSKNQEGYFAKLELNISINKNQPKKYISFFNSLGFETYCIVKKNRTSYSKTENGLIYTISIDKIKNTGSFVEFEILLDPDLKVNYEKKLNEFINKYCSYIGSEVNKPYRDLVKTLYNN